MPVNYNTLFHRVVPLLELNVIKMTAHTVIRVKEYRDI